MIVIPICLKCEYCKVGMVCKIHPEGIPHEILSAQKDPEDVCWDFKEKYKK